MTIDIHSISDIGIKRILNEAALRHYMSVQPVNMQDHDAPALYVYVDSIHHCDWYSMGVHLLTKEAARRGFKPFPADRLKVGDALPYSSEYSGDAIITAINQTWLEYIVDSGPSRGQYVRSWGNDLPPVVYC